MTQRIVLSVTALVLLAAACGGGSGAVLTTPGAGAGPAQATTMTVPVAAMTVPASTAAPTTRTPVGPAVLELVSAAPPEPGQQFDVRYGPPVGLDYRVDVRGEGFILSRGGKKLFWLFGVTRSLPPHYGPFRHSDSGNGMAFIAGKVTLVWPEGLGPGTYELCASSYGDATDTCATITVDK